MIEVGCMHGTRQIGVDGTNGRCDEGVGKNRIFLFARSVADQYAIDPDFYKDSGCAYSHSEEQFLKMDLLPEFL